MGAQGEDLMLSQAARDLFPYSIECKNQEAINIWAAWNQATTNSGGHQPLLIIKRNRAQPLAVVDAKHFIQLSTGGKNEVDVDEK